jgi:hypothetical protein
MEETRRRFRIAAVLGAAIALLAGCATPFSMKYVPGRPPRLLAAPREAQYALYANGTVVPEFTLVLMKGQPIGFKLAHDGSVFGIAGDYSQKLRLTKYRWVDVNFNSERSNTNASEFLTAIGLFTDFPLMLLGLNNSNELYDRSAEPANYVPRLNSNDETRWTNQVQFMEGD